MEEVKKEQNSGKIDTEVLLQYYKKFFPYQDIVNWLSYEKPPKEGEEYGEYFKNRELSFVNDGDIVIRYQSFRNAKDFMEGLTHFSAVKMDIGPVYNMQPKFYRQYQKSERRLIPLERELIFDIDMTDYDNIRTCCKGATICLKCWKFIQCVYQVLNRALTEDFGFEHIMWVYSGRRGIHCWVCDERARKLSDEVRESIVDYLSIDVGNENSETRIDIKKPWHHSLVRAIKILKPEFEKINEEQQLLDQPHHQEMLLKFFGKDEEMKEKLIQKWKSDKTCSAKWESFKHHISSIRSKKTDREEDTIIEEVIFKFLYPRIDANVSKKVNHLLKSAFSLHPSTGRVCVPIKDVTNFNPFTCPTINDLLVEHTRFIATNPEATIDQFIDQSSIAEYIHHFREFIDKLPKYTAKTIGEIHTQKFEEMEA